MIEIISQGEQETRGLAERIAQAVVPGTVVSLVGDLGAGKTFFTAALTKALGSEEQVTSPTFGLMNIYHGRLPIYHFDLYRLERESELADFGFSEYVEDETAVSLIEWADKFPGALPEDYIEIRLDRLPGEDETTSNFRKITVAAAAGSQRAAHWLKEWEEKC